MKPALDAVREETSREIFNGAKDFVAFALATGGDLRLLATACPCVTQGAPLGKAGLIFKQDQPLAPLRRPYNRRPLLLQPGEALRCIAMIRHKPSLLKRKPQVVEKGTDILTVGEHAELAPDQHPNEHRVPTRRLTAHDEWSGLLEIHQAALLLGGQLRSATTAMAVAQTLQAMQQKGLLPVVETGGTEAPALAQDRQGHVVHEEVDQHRGPPHQTHIVFEVGLLQPGV